MKVLWWKSREKAAETDDNDPVDEIIQTQRDISEQLKQLIVIVQRIDQHYYKGRAKANGQQETPAGQFPWAAFGKHE